MLLRYIAISLTFISASFASFSFAQSGEESYQQCITCHGQSGEGNAQLNSPAIAGQFDWYLTRQINNFKNNIRGAHSNDVLGQQMAAIAKPLNNKEVPELVQYIASLPSPKTTPSEGDLKNGMSYYQGKCGACHGGTAEGNASLNAPKLTGLSANYLNKQMQSFINGIRGTEKEDKLGRQMAMMAKITQEKELKDIIHFITSQNSVK